MLNPLNNINEENKYYKIPYKHEKNILINEYHKKSNHCGREFNYENLLKANWYWYRIIRDIQN